ncbi:MAG: alpha/beta fold hydrolase, partial [Ignavibacterium sp.]|nr:alpha/beta fold hydrolase [Ignavibacterium sp.]
ADDLLKYAGVYKNDQNRKVVIALAEMNGFMLSYADLGSEELKFLMRQDDTHFFGGNTIFPQNPDLVFAFENNFKTLVITKGTQNQTFEKEKVKEDKYTFTSNNFRLAGTLSVPQNVKKKLTTVILVHGSGAATRYQMDMFRQILLSNGVAVFAFDKRGNGESEGEKTQDGKQAKDLSIEEFAEDVSQAFEMLKQNPKVNPKKIGILGSSQGGMVAWVVANKVKDLAFIVNISGNTLPVYEQDLYERTKNLESKNYKPEDLEESIAFEKTAIDAVRGEIPFDEFKKLNEASKNKIWYQEVRSWVDERHLNSAWATQLKHNPYNYIKTCRVPVLYCVGDLDAMQDGQKCAEIAERGLLEAKNPDYLVKLFPKGHHAMILGMKGGTNELMQCKQFVNGFIPTLLFWVQNR